MRILLRSVRDLQSGDKIVSVDGHEFHTVLPLVDYMQIGQGKAGDADGGSQGRDACRRSMIHPITGGRLAPWDSSQRVQRRAGARRADEVLERRRRVARLLRGEFAADCQRAEEGADAPGFSEAAFRSGRNCRGGWQAVKERYWLAKFGLAAGISLNLGILNLLPFPILDGGLILLLLIESIMRRDISMIVKERIYQAAFVVLVAFFAFVMFNDFSKLQIFSHLKP